MVAVTGSGTSGQVFRRDLRLVEGYGKFQKSKNDRVLVLLRNVLIFGTMLILALLSYSLGVGMRASSPQSNGIDGNAGTGGVVTYTVKVGDSVPSIAGRIASSPSQFGVISKEISAVEGNGQLIPGTVLHIVK